jgi:hypothetical protein
MKILIFDSGTLINLSMTGLLYVLEELKKSSQVRFAITLPVKYEVVDRPIGIPRFELGALRVQNLIDAQVLELPEAFGIKEEKIKALTKDLVQAANSCIRIKGSWVSIVSEGEISCLALAKELEAQGHETMIAIDERTTRILAEKPENLEEIMSKKLHAHVKVDRKNLKVFEDFRFIRSTEIVFVAYKKNLLQVQGKKALEAALYATKYNGSSVSFEEIESMKKI